MEYFTSILAFMLLLAATFGCLGIILLLKEGRIKRASQHILGIVVGYSVRHTHAPIVEYIVNGTTYRKALKYSVAVSTSTPFNLNRTEPINFLDTKLRIRNNSLVNFSSSMIHEFPLGGQMNVYYNLNNPKEAYVERYAKNYTGRVFMFVALIMLLIAIVLYFVFRAVEGVA